MVRVDWPANVFDALLSLKTVISVYLGKTEY